jgi:hypothetical protein
MNGVSRKSDFKVIFFIRHVPDTDHCVPIIHKWLQKNEGSAEIILTSHLASVDDPRIRFLQETHGVSVHTIDGLYAELVGPRPPESFPSKPLNIWVSRAYRLLGKSIARRLADLSYLYDCQFIKAMLDKFFAGVPHKAVVFDPVFVASYRLENAIIEEAKAQDIPRLCFPHSNDPHLNLMIIGGMLNMDDYDFPNRPLQNTGFNHVAYSNHVMAERNSSRGIPESQSKIVGCARYSREWIDTLPTIYQPYQWEESKGLRKILVLPRGKNYPIFWDELAQFIRIALQFDNVCVIIMDHVRGNRVPQIASLGDKLTPSERSRLRILNDVGSVPLILWCDLVLDLMTGVAFDAVRRNIPVLELECLQTNKSAIGTYLTASRIDDRDQFFHTMKAFSQGQMDLENFYDPEELEVFVREMIEQNGPNVLGDYVRFIEDAMNVKDAAPAAATHH